MFIAEPKQFSHIMFWKVLFVKNILFANFIIIFA